MAVPDVVPKAVRRGPPITLTCRCGERREVRYGDSWTCEKCGRTWNTLRIPMDQYAEIRRAQLRYRRVPIAMSSVVLASIIALIIVGKAFGGLILVAFVAMAWSTWIRPARQRRYRQQIANLPSWEIEPE
jgi:hypothetical protein